MNKLVSATFITVCTLSFVACNTEPSNTELRGLIMETIGVGPTQTKYDLKSFTVKSAKLSHPDLDTKSVDYELSVTLEIKTPCYFKKDVFKEGKIKWPDCKTAEEIKADVDGVDKLTPVYLCGALNFGPDFCKTRYSLPEGTPEEMKAAQIARKEAIPAQYPDLFQPGKTMELEAFNLCVAYHDKWAVGKPYMCGRAF